MYLKVEKERMIVDTFAMEVYLPFEYADSAYRGAPYYSILGTKVKFLGVGNMRFFSSQKELDDPLSVKSHPLGVPMLIMSEPTDIETREIRLSKTGPVRKSIVLTYLKGDAFMVNTETIKDMDAMMMTLSRLEQGKLDHVPPEVAVQIIRDCEKMNGVNLRMPSEEMEIFVAERYRDPAHPSRKYRYATGTQDPDAVVTYNMRTDAIQSNTFTAVMHQDINNSLIASINRKEAGIVDEAAPFERVIRGMDLEEYKKADHRDQEETAQ